MRMFGRFLMAGVFCVSSAVYAGTLDFAFTLTRGQKATLHLDTATYKSTVEVGKRTISVNLLQSVDKEYLSTVLAGDHEVPLFTFDDVNFDGYADIGVLLGDGMTGNTERRYYLYRPSTMDYKAYPYGIINLERMPKDKLLYSQIIGRPGMSKLYEIGRDGMPYEMMEIVLAYPKEEDADFLVDVWACNTQINVPKAHFYKHPATGKQKTYLIKGNRVAVINFAAEDDEPSWVEVRYQGKHKVFTGWMHLTDIHFQPCPVVISAMVKDGVEKSYFYDKKNGKKRRAFIVMYDRVDVLQHDATWLKGHYVNAKGKATVGWLKTSDFELESSIQCCRREMAQ